MELDYTERPGLFLTLEGVDGAGTTTQLGRLLRRLEARGERPVGTREPSDGPIGTLIRQVLRGRLVGAAGEGFSSEALALLFAADRLDHVSAEIEPAVSRGEIVISDRYVHSSLAYQALDLPLEWVRGINARARRPHAVIYVRVPAAVALQRVEARQGARRERFEQMHMLERVVEFYENLCAQDGDWIVVDGTQMPDHVEMAIASELSARWPGRL